LLPKQNINFLLGALNSKLFVQTVLIGSQIFDIPPHWVVE